MAKLATLGNTVAWRDYVTDGVPSSGANSPRKQDIRAFITELDARIKVGEGSRENSFILSNVFPDTPSAENHEAVRITKRNSISIGPDPGTNDNRLDNQSALEISFSNPGGGGGSGTPISVGEWSVGAAAEPALIVKRFYNETIGGEGAVVAGTVVLSLQAQVDDGLDTANVAIGNLLCRVTSGATITPSAGNVRTYPGEWIFATAPGDGSTAITSRLLVKSNGDIDLVSGNLILGAVNTVISSTRRGRFSAMRPDTRAAVADDSIYQYTVPGGTTAIIEMIPTALGATTPMVGFACRVDSAACEKLYVSGTADAASNVVFQTGVVSDYTTCADGKLTISAASDGIVYIVNRLGASKTFAYHARINSQTA